MNDLEHDLRRLLADKASLITTDPSIPSGIRKRARQRQIMTGAAGTLAALAVIVVCVLGVRALTSDGRQAVPAAPGPSTTIDVGFVSLSAPRGWPLLDLFPLAKQGQNEGAQAPGQFSSSPPPLMQLSNFDPGPRYVCGGESTYTPAGVPADGVLFSVAIRAYDSEPNAIRPDTVDDLPAALDQAVPQAGPCGTGIYLRWGKNHTDSGGESAATYLGFLVIGSDASSTDRALIERAIASLRLTYGKSAPNADRVNYVLDGGTVNGTPWTLRTDTAKSGTEIYVASGASTTGASDFTVPEGTAIEATTATVGAGGTGTGDGNSAGRGLVFGAVDPRAARLVLSGDDQYTADATILFLPESMHAPFHAFLVELPGSSTFQLLGGTFKLRAYDADGNEIGHTEVLFSSPGGHSGTQPTTPVATPAGP